MPDAAALKVADCPVATVWLAGWVVMDGAVPVVLPVLLPLPELIMLETKTTSRK